MKTSTLRTILLTGGASGIGAATARIAVKRGHKVLIADINLQGAQRVAADIGENAAATALDVTSDEQWGRVLHEAWSRFGRLDVLINNAGVVHPGRSLDVPMSGHQHTLDINFMGAMRGMLAATPRFKAQGSGHLVTVCSMSAFLPFPGLGSYAASKHALRAFHYALAIEERAGPVKFTIVHPTATETPMLEQEAENDDAALAFAGASVSAQFVGEVVVDSMEQGVPEVFMPPERASFVRRTGTTLRSLVKMVVRGSEVGAKNLAARRAARATT